MGQRESTNNPFLITNSKYNKIKKRVPSMRNYNRGVSYGHSVEYYDFQLMLDLLKKSVRSHYLSRFPSMEDGMIIPGFPRMDNSLLQAD